MKVCQTCEQEASRLVKLMCVKCWKKQYRQTHAQQIADYMAGYREANKERLKESTKQYRENNPEKVKIWKAQWQKTEKGMAYQRKVSKEWRDAGKTKGYEKKSREANKEKAFARGKKWRETYPWRHSAKEARRRALKHSATPRWFSDKDAVWLELMFAMCKKLEEKSGTKYHIDHRIPLKNNVVCGLHWRENWSLLPASENLSKSNFFKEQIV
jgi:hypothetical protein